METQKMISEKKEFENMAVKFDAHGEVLLVQVKQRFVHLNLGTDQHLNTSLLLRPCLSY